MATFDRVKYTYEYLNWPNLAIANTTLGHANDLVRIAIRSLAD